MLNDTKVRKAAPGEKDYKLGDALGLFLLVRPSGSKLWRMKYRVHGKEKKLSFGPYPEVTLAEAREKRDAARKLIRDGLDPALEKKRDAATAKVRAVHTLESVARDWHELQAPRWAPKHARITLRNLERDVFPEIGDMPVTAIDAPLLLDTLRKIERRGAIETARRIRQSLSAVFVHAIATGIATTDPAAIITKALKPQPKAKHQPAATDLAELRRILSTTEASGAYPVTLYASRLLALTAARPGTLRGARWSEFHGIDWRENENAQVNAHMRDLTNPIWHIPAERMKLVLDRKDEEAFDHIVPLTRAAVDVVRAVRVLSGRGDLVFPGQRHAHKPLSENAIGYLYNRCGWHGRHVPHGWRAAFSTVMNEWAKKHGRADDRAVIDLMLAHVPKNRVEAAYNRAEFMERRRELAEVWADMLMEGQLPAADLLPLSRRKS